MRVFILEGLIFIFNEAQSSSAQSPNGPGGNFQRPYFCARLSVAMDTKFSMYRSAGQADSARGVLGAFLNRELLRFREAGRRHINCFFEVRALERIGLVENRQHLKNSVRKETFDGYFPA